MMNDGNKNFEQELESQKKQNKTLIKEIVNLKTYISNQQIQIRELEKNQFRANTVTNWYKEELGRANHVVTSVDVKIDSVYSKIFPIVEKLSRLKILLPKIINDNKFRKPKFTPISANCNKSKSGGQNGHRVRPMVGGFPISHPIIKLERVVIPTTYPEQVLNVPTRNSPLPAAESNINVSKLTRSNDINQGIPNENLETSSPDPALPGSDPALPQSTPIDKVEEEEASNKNVDEIIDALFSHVTNMSENLVHAKDFNKQYFSSSTQSCNYSETNSVSESVSSFNQSYFTNPLIQTQTSVNPTNNQTSHKVMPMIDGHRIVTNPTVLIQRINHPLSNCTIYSENEISSVSNSSEGSESEIDEEVTEQTGENTSPCQEVTPQNLSIVLEEEIEESNDITPTGPPRFAGFKTNVPGSRHNRHRSTLGRRKFLNTIDLVEAGPSRAVTEEPIGVTIRISHRIKKPSSLLTNPDFEIEESSRSHISEESGSSNSSTEEIASSSSLTEETVGLNLRISQRLRKPSLLLKNPDFEIETKRPRNKSLEEEKSPASDPTTSELIAKITTRKLTSKTTRKPARSGAETSIDEPKNKSRKDSNDNESPAQTSTNASTSEGISKTKKNSRKPARSRAETSINEPKNKSPKDSKDNESPAQTSTSVPNTRSLRKRSEKNYKELGLNVKIRRQ
uniref:Uncharacterized protein n=1 Tax=Clastoptera arizonana TaxID=38151 RepID=A0A1B6CV14_9HEMI